MSRISLHRGCVHLSLRGRHNIALIIMWQSMLFVAHTVTVAAVVVVIMIVSVTAIVCALVAVIAFVAQSASVLCEFT